MRQVVSERGACRSLPLSPQWFCSPDRMSLVPNVELKLFCIACCSFPVWGCPWALELLVQPRLGHQDAFIWSFCDPVRIKGGVTGLMTQFLFGLGSL